MQKTLEFKWSTSRGRTSYGYPLCTLFVDGRKVAAYNGGGYDMKGSCLGDYIASAYADRLLRLKPEQMEEHSHWERAKNPRRLCDDIACLVANAGKDDDESYPLPPDAMTCPRCGSATRPDYRDGETVNDGRYFYGLTFHDPKFDPGKAVIGEGCDDRTFERRAIGETVEQAEAAGKSLGLERYQAVYAASSKVPTERHTIPSIDGACGFEAVERIAKAIGLTLAYVPAAKGKRRRGRADVYLLNDGVAK